MPDQNEGRELVSRNLPPQAVGVADPIQLGKVLAASGYFADSKDAAQAAVRVMAGAEMGFGPIASMTGVHIIKGKISVGANLIASAIKRSGGAYDYRILRLDGQGCEIEFYERGVSVGISSFTDDDRKAAKLGGGTDDNWAKYGKNMYFARAMTNGARWYCAAIFGGPVYTPEEMGAVIDGETGEILEASRAAPPVQARPAPKPAPQPEAAPPAALEGEPVGEPPCAADADPVDPSVATPQQLGDLLALLAERWPKEGEQVKWLSEQGCKIVGGRVASTLATFSAVQAQYLLEEIRAVAAQPGLPV